MILSDDILPEAAEIIAGIHPKDRTIRPQVLTEGFNPGYYCILEEFSRRTWIGACSTPRFTSTASRWSTTWPMPSLRG